MSQDWEGVQVVDHLPGRGRGVNVTRPFVPEEVICDYSERLLSHKEGKKKYDSSAQDAMGYMFAFRHRGVGYWRDATEELPGPGRLINHSKCHSNVSTRNCDAKQIMFKAGS